LSDADGQLLVTALMEQSQHPRPYPLSKQDEQRLKGATSVRSGTKQVFVDVPSDDGAKDETELPSQVIEEAPVRASLKVQAALAKIGIEMGFVGTS
jgi:hypothetical protein